MQAGLDLSWLNGLLAESHLPEPPAVAVVDAAGQILARYPEPKKWVGRSFPDAPFVRAALSQQQEGTLEGSGLDGTPRLFTFTPLRSRERERIACVYIRIPCASVFAKTKEISEFRPTCPPMGTIHDGRKRWPLTNPPIGIN